MPEQSEPTYEQVMQATHGNTNSDGSTPACWSEYEDPEEQEEPERWDGGLI